MRYAKATQNEMSHAKYSRTMAAQAMSTYRTYCIILLLS